VIDIKRRELLLGLGVAGAGIALSPRFSNAQSKKNLKILVLGGTGYIGPHIVRRALERGHEVTLFNRGRSNTDLFPDIEKLVGDRDGGLDVLKTGHWDVVLDNSGYVPRLIRDSAELLKDRAGRYLFTSSVSAYDFTTGVFPLTPDSKLNAWTDPDSEDVGKYYGEFKAQCERIVKEVYSDGAIIVRPTFIIGPGDKSQRFTWWVDRIYRGGDVLAPGNPDTSFDIIDVRDLAEVYIHLLEENHSGTFNVTGPAGRLSFGGMLNGIRATTNTPLNFHWVDAEFLQGQDLKGGELPMWWDLLDGVTEKLTENQSSIDAGLRYRPLSKTAIDTLAWHRQLPKDKQAFTRVGITPEKEARILAAWHQHQRKTG